MKDSYEDEARKLVAQTDPAAVAAIIASYPEVEDIGFRDNPESCTPNLKLPPTEPEKLRLYLSSKIEKYRIEKEISISQYLAIRKNGLAAISAYDVNVSSGGKPLQALETALSLIKAHISYNSTIMRNLNIQISKLNKEIGLQECFDFF